MAEIDKRGKLDEEPFSYKLSKDKKVFIHWQGKPVTILKEKESNKFIERIATASTKEAQLIMAKTTGNFKHGNERKYGCSYHERKICMHEYYYDRPLMDGIWEISDKTDGINTTSFLYLIEGSDRALLIDAGNSDGDLLGHIKKLTDKPIDLVLTHGHGDHTAGLSKFESVYLSHKDITMLNELFGYQLNETMVKDLYSGQSFDLGGCCLEVLEFPGHSQGCMLLLDRQRQLLFTGDALGSTVIWMQLPQCSPVEAYAGELRNLELLVKDMNDLRIYVGHDCSHPDGFTKQYITDIRILAEKIVSGEVTGTPTEDTSEMFGGLTASYGEMTGFIYKPYNIYIKND